jgi:hypothetical protein
MQTNTKELKIDEANLEHVYPQNPSEKEWGGSENQALLDPYTWHIGNLTMLGVRLNRKVSNKEYPAKQKHYAGASELEMPKQLAATYKEWNVDSITKRAESLVPKILEVWQFDNNSRV